MKKIGIAGAGGIGSNVAVNLIRSGVKNIKIVDFDIIDQSNLNRQFYFEDQVGILKSKAIYENLSRINKSANIQAINSKLNENNIKEIFDDCEIIVEAFDVKENKIMLIEQLLESKDLIVSASGVADYDIESMKITKIAKNLYIVGDNKKDISEYKTYSSKVSTAAAMMANLVLEKGGFYE
ncbi:MAG: sulfur carrier protein ThiS adenylyltransferase ThiF [bacterium]|nr:sulfur carrier protein ThiS adenylyltransferase ThiF [bacterium]